MSCIYCTIKSGVYDCKCPQCRTRLALAEPCKVIRKQLVESMRKRYGETENWKAEPNCGCDIHCKRRIAKESAKQDVDYDRYKR